MMGRRMSHLNALGAPLYRGRPITVAPEVDLLTNELLQPFNVSGCSRAEGVKRKKVRLRYLR